MITGHLDFTWCQLRPQPLLVEAHRRLGPSETMGQRQSQSSRGLRTGGIRQTTGTRLHIHLALAPTTAVVSPCKMWI